MALAAAERRMIDSEDTDFGALLARTQTPSFILLRGAEPMGPDDQAALLLANLPAVESVLLEGAIVVFARGRIRVRLRSPDLPICARATAGSDCCAAPADDLPTGARSSYFVFS